MKICFPVQHDDGVESAVYNHFGSAPLFALVESETKAVTMINNRDKNHVQGQCNPLKALDNQKIDVVIVGGIGAGALSRLNQAGIKVYRAESGTISENLKLFADGALSAYSLQGGCSGHGHSHGHGGSGCAH